MVVVNSLIELCFMTIMEKMEYNNSDLQRIPPGLIEKLINFMVFKLHPNHLSLQTISKPIRIKLVKQNRVITMRFSIYSTIDKIVHQIFERVSGEEKMEQFEKQKTLSNNNLLSLMNNNNTTTTTTTTTTTSTISSPTISSPTKSISWGSIENYGLFQSSGAFRNARWLQLDKTLAFYEIDSNETLEFKTSKNVLKIRFFGPWERVVHPLHQSTMLDETIKTFVIDESKTVSEISVELAKKLQLKYPEELSLKLQVEEDDARGVWLSADLTLPEQNIDPLYSIFLLKRQFFFCKDIIIDFSMDPEILHFVFCQCLDAIIDTSHPCSPNESILFAALQCQICFGDYVSGSKEIENIRVRDFLPLEFINQKGILKEVLVQYQKLVGMSEQKAKLNYIQLAKSLKTYGYTFFKVFNKQNSSQLFGISADAVLILESETNSTISLYSLSNIKKWQILNNVFSIEFNDKKENFISVEAEAISHVLSSYIHHNLRSTPTIQKKWDENYIIVGRNSLNSNNRKRLSTCSNCSTDSVEYESSSSFNRNKDWKYQSGLIVKKCALYIEPKKLYINPLSTQITGSMVSKEFANKDTKVAKVLKVLTDLSSKMILSFSKTSPAKEREIVVKFSDKKVKSFIVDEQKTVSEITHEIGLKLGIKNPEEFSLQLIISTNNNNNSNNTSLNNNSDNNNVNNNNNNVSYSNNSFITNSSNNNNNNNNNNQILNSNDESLSLSSSLSGIWLKPYQPLSEQSVASDCNTLLFKKKFYTSDIGAADDCNSDPVYFNLLFFQSKDAIISNTYTCSKDEAIQLAATLFQINFGDHNPNIHKPGFLKSRDLKFFLPPNSLELWGLSFQKIEKSIYKEHQNLRGIKEVYAKYRYVQLCRSLKTFGAIFFSVRQLNHNNSNNHHDNNDSGNGSGSGSGSSGNGSSSGNDHSNSIPYNQPLVLGFSRKCILFMTAKTKKFLVEYPLTHLRRYAYHKELQQLTLDFGDYDMGRLIFQTRESEEISSYLGDYIDYIQTKLVGSQSFSTNNLIFSAPTNLNQPNI